jgi:predicted RNA-binding protein with PIN domain
MRGAARWRVGPKGFWGGVIESLGLAVLFPALGLLWAGAVLPVTDPEPHYPDGIVELIPAETPRIWLVDGFNVVQVGLLGGRERDHWWREPRRAELLARAASFDARDDELWVVFDGHRDDGAGPAGRRLHPVFAPSADEWLVARVVAEPDPGRVSVVTADRRLAARVRRRGASVVSPAEFLRRCPG